MDELAKNKITFCWLTVSAIEVTIHSFACESLKGEKNDFSPHRYQILLDQQSNGISEWGSFMGAVLWEDHETILQEYSISLK